MRQTNCKKKFGRITTVLCMVLLLVSVAGLFVSCGQDDETGGTTKQAYTSLEDFRDKRIGVLTGTIQGAVKKVEDPASRPAKNGVLKLATDTGNPPVSYRGEEQIIGIDIDIVTRFCKANGYGLQREGTLTSSLEVAQSRPPRSEIGA